MRVKYTVKCSGLKVTAENKNDPAIKELFRIVCPKIDIEYRAKQSEIQNAVADNGASVRRTVDTSRSKSWLSIGPAGDFGVAVTAESAAKILGKLDELGDLLDDRTFELNAWRNSPEAQAALAKAQAAGAKKFRDPVAKIEVTLFVREEEEKFVFENIPNEILGKIKILREMPLEVVPLYDCADNVRALMADMEKHAVEAKGGAVYNQIRSTKEVLNRAIGILDTLDLGTTKGRTFRDNLIAAIRRADVALDQVAAIGNWRWIKSSAHDLLVDEIDVAKNSGLDEYELRVTGGNSAFDPNPKKSALEDKDIDMLDI